MKNLLIIAALMFGAAAAHAAADTTFDGPVRSPDLSTKITTVRSTATVITIDIASHTATSVVGSTLQMYNWVEVQNKSALCSVFCGESVLLSTQPANANAGWEIARSSNAVTLPSYHFDIPPGKDFFCSSGCANTTSRVTVRRGR